MKKTPVKGTKDFLPNEVEIRGYLQRKILEVYRSSGFNRISTPVIEDIENLDKSEGGENLNLIFRILKRGDKLKNSLDSLEFKELCDMGLRYDLTLPLSRYYANNKEKLTLPMKCIQIDKVYRAERPQYGRSREFVQCDIDIIGSDSINSEIELIYTTSKALNAVGINDFIIKINDRRILKSLLLSIGIDSDQLDTVCLCLDKFGKIGADGVLSELLDKQVNQASANKLIELLSSNITLSTIEEITGEAQIVGDLNNIIDSVTELSNGKLNLVFDITLVRGQGYYTGTIFEIESTKFESSIGGGGRYDNLIGKFTGENVPAVGFSIGFERIYSLLMESGFVIPERKNKIAIIYMKEDFLEAYMQAENYRNNYDVLLYEQPKKLGKFLERLTQDGFYGFIVYGKDSEIKQLT